MTKLIHILPVIIMAESFLAVIPLALAGQWSRALYWFAAGLLNFAVIFCIKS